MTTLHTARLTLTPSVPADAADLMALERDPDVMRFLNGGHAVDHANDHSNATFLMPRGTEDYVWTARYISNNAFVGWFCLWPDSDAIAELGYRLKRANWGQGLAAEGALALMNWAFENCGYDRIIASTMARPDSRQRAWRG
jgi:RimJ/RimL family protein N-acetyltransferase